MRKRIACLLSLLIVIMPVATLAAEMPPTHEALAEIEVMLYGGAGNGPLASRLERIEGDLFGTTQTGAFVARLSRAYDYISGENLIEGSVVLKLNVIEWSLFQKLSVGSVVNRLAEIEKQFYGEIASGSIFSRINRLNNDIFPSSSFQVDNVIIPVGTLIKIRLDSSINSEETKPGTTVAYTVAEDVKINGRLAIPAGAQGRGTVLNVSPSGNMGKGGVIEISWGSILAIDGTRIDVGMTDKSISKFNSSSEELAAMASIAGAVMLSPVGLAAGFFVKGKPMVIDKGTEFFVDVRYETRVGGVTFK
ncbi:MAG TPA: TrbI/VirB10 family protein [Firmicutes bacterium]|jgi:hypothetical protein|nr:TrbI/VirB10 family protein [Bacillota bacterium]